MSDKEANADTTTGFEQLQKKCGYNLNKGIQKPTEEEFEKLVDEFHAMLIGLVKEKGREKIKQTITGLLDRQESYQPRIIKRWFRKPIVIDPSQDLIEITHSFRLAFSNVNSMLAKIREQNTQNQHT